jgi:bacterioferritin
MGGIDYNLHKRVGYSDPAPYPEVRICAQNQYYLELIMDDYAGIVSEFTAINQYLYHYFTTKECGEELGEMLENVAITEMLHMEILAELIQLLGGRPTYRGGPSTKGGSWNTKFVYYGCNVCDILHADLNAEYRAIQSYQEHIRVISDPYIQAILERIVLDEKVHVGLFKTAIENHCCN